jgi:hypothetical protein
MELSMSSQWQGAMERHRHVVGGSLDLASQLTYRDMLVPMMIRIPFWQSYRRDDRRSSACGRSAVM